MLRVGALRGASASTTPTPTAAQPGGTLARFVGSSRLFRTSTTTATAAATANLYNHRGGTAAALRPSASPSLLPRSRSSSLLSSSSSVVILFHQQHRPHGHHHHSHDDHNPSSTTTRSHSHSHSHSHGPSIFGWVKGKLTGKDPLEEEIVHDFEDDFYESGGDMAVEGEEEETEESLRQKLREQHEAAVRNEKKALQITWAGFAFNIVLAAGKGVAGFVGHSQALLADAFHSLSDSVSDAVTLWAVHTIKKPENYKYPYGYGKFETLGTFLVSATLVGTGIVLTQQCIDTVLLTIDTSHFHLPSLEDLFSNSNVDSTSASASAVGSDTAAVASEAAHSHAHSHSHHHGHSHIHWDPSQGPTNVALYGALGSILFKELLFQANLRIGQQAHSNLLIANAWHHRADAISSIIALIGIVGAQLGFTALDGLAGGVVGVMIIKMGADMALGSIYELVDSSVGTHDVRQDIVHTLRKSLRQLNHKHRQLSSAAASATPQKAEEREKEERREEHNANTETNKKRNPNKELNRRHKVLLNYKNQDLRVRKLGTYFIADLRLEVNSRLGVAEADRLLKKVQSDLLTAVPRLKEVIVSFDVFDEQTGLILNSETVDLERLKKQPPREGLSQLQQQQSEGEKMKKEEEASSS